MSFQEKSTLTVLVAFVLTYGWYFIDLAANHGINGYDGYQKQVLVMTIAFVVIVALSHAVIALVDPKGSDETDERDKEINRFGEYVGGYVLGAQSLVVLAMALLEVPHFLIANNILLGLVLAEIVGGSVKLWLYRRGF